MTIEQNIFRRAKIDFSKLAAYGFEKCGREFVYRQAFMNADFNAVVKIDEKGNVSGEVVDVATSEAYLPLRVEGATGFAALVRTQYEKILEDIKAKCCQINYFIYSQANRLAAKICEKYGDKPCFPWDTFDGYGVFKNPDNGKWYALILPIDKSKLDKALSGQVEIVNIKLDSNEISDLIKQKGFYPAYHMNKKYWISIILDDSVADEFVFELLDESHSFTLSKKRKK